MWGNLFLTHSSAAENKKNKAVWAQQKQKLSNFPAAEARDCPLTPFFPLTFAQIGQDPALADLAESCNCDFPPCPHRQPGFSQTTRH
jgi:hypothetical protein